MNDYIFKAYALDGEIDLNRIVDGPRSGFEE